MITFACHQCGTKFATQPHFGGKQFACQHCKAALQVPLPEVEVVYPPPPKPMPAPLRRAPAPVEKLKPVIYTFPTESNAMP